jgi:large subunit ribosomal protein L25
MHYEEVEFVTREPGLPDAQIKANRRNGWIPGVISRGNEPPTPISLPEKRFANAVHKTGVGGIMRLIDEKGGGHLAQLKELQWHPTSRKLLHASFTEVRAREEVVANVPLIFHGEPEAVATKSGQLVRSSEAIAVRARVTDLPDAIGIDISELQVGDTVTAGDVVLPPGCEAAHPDTVICSLIPPTVAVEAEAVALAGEEPAEPELVGSTTQAEEGEG